VDQSKKELGGIKKKILEEKQRVKDISRKDPRSSLNQFLTQPLGKGKGLRFWGRRRGGLKVQKANQDLNLLGR
jgi:hypothetical protein